MTSEPAHTNPAGHWTRLDGIALGVVTLIAAGLRFIGLTQPRGLVFDEFYYAPDACRYVSESSALCGSGELTYFHPPLAKWLISWGIQIWGPNQLGWRAPAALFGTLTCVCVYLLARKLLRSTVAATFASGLLAVDFLHLVLSRVAMLDVFVTFFGTLAVLFSVYDRSDPRTGFWRPWRCAAGVAGGAAIASKWSGVTMLLLVIVISLLSDRAEARNEAGKKRPSVLSIAVWLVLVPLALYMVTHIGRVEGDLLALPWAEGSWVKNFVLRQVDGYLYQAEVKSALSGAVHPYSSPPWTWLLLKRPIAFYFVVFATGEYSEILGLGNPLVWWLSIPALVFTSIRALRPSSRDAAAGVIIGGFAAGYFLWFLLSIGGPDPYSFYVLPAIPFMCLGLGYAAAILWRRSVGRAATIAFGAAVIGLLAFFYPILTARSLTPDRWQSRMWFAACRYERTTTPGQELREAGLPIVEDPGGVVPPRAIIPNQTRGTGWCWI